MRSILVFTLLAGVLSAPTPTVESRMPGHHLSSLDERDFASLLEKLGGSNEGVDWPDLGSLFGLSGSSSSSSEDDSATSSLPDLGSLLGGFGGSSGSDDSSSSGGFGGLLGGFLGGSSSSNDVTNKASCKPLTFIFARGTTEIGNMGTVVGPKVASALSSRLKGKVNVQGVNYPASAAGNAVLGAEGGPKMADLVRQALKQCPKTKVVLGGYSQGAMVVHNAADRLQDGQVVGAVTFGDPFKAIPPKHIKNYKTFCATGDPVCLSGANVLAHISYGKNAQEAAQFLLKAAGL